MLSEAPIFAALRQALLGRRLACITKNGAKLEAHAEKKKKPIVSACVFESVVEDDQGVLLALA